MKCVWRAIAVGALLVFPSVSGAVYIPVNIHLPGYSYTPLAEPNQYSVTDAALDPAGNLYLSDESYGAVMRVTPNGTKSTWSGTPVSDLIFTATGQAYAAGGMSCNCIHSMLPDGSPTTLHADSVPWAFLALGNDGTLYATIMAGFGQGLYTIDRVTGTPTLLKAGGPGPNGTGIYRSLLVGMDGELYASGNMNGPGLLRLEGGQFTKLASYPKTGYALAQDADGFFYTVSQTNNIFGGYSHEVWKIDPTDWSCTLLADGPAPAAAIAYDRERDRLYVSTIHGTVYFITRVPVPTRSETWGAVKARYR